MLYEGWKKNSFLLSSLKALIILMPSQNVVLLNRLGEAGAWRKVLSALSTATPRGPHCPHTREGALGNRHTVTEVHYTCVCGNQVESGANMEAWWCWKFREIMFNIWGLFSWKIRWICGILKLLMVFRVISESEIHIFVNFYGTSV